MAAVFGREEVGLKATGRAVTVPNDPRARIMYYLDCVFTLIGAGDLPREIRRLANFRSYSSMSSLDCVALLALAKELSPDTLSGQVIFQSDEMCGTSSNKFYEISVLSTRMVVADEILIGGQRRRVQKIMAFKMRWLHDYYLEPILQLIAMLERQTRALPSPSYGRQSRYSEHRPLIVRQQRSSSNDGCCCTIL